MVLSQHILRIYADNFTDLVYVHMDLNVRVTENFSNITLSLISYPTRFIALAFFYRGIARTPRLLKIFWEINANTKERNPIGTGPKTLQMLRTLQTFSTVRFSIRHQRLDLEAMVIRKTTGRSKMALSAISSALIQFRTSFAETLPYYHGLSRVSSFLLDRLILPCWPQQRSVRLRWKY